MADNLSGDHPERATLLTSAAIAVWAGGRLAGLTDPIARSTAYLAMVVEATGPDHPERGRRLAALGIAILTPSGHPAPAPLPMPPPGISADQRDQAIGYLDEAAELLTRIPGGGMAASVLLTLARLRRARDDPGQDDRARSRPGRPGRVGRARFRGLPAECHPERSRPSADGRRRRVGGRDLVPRGRRDRRRGDRPGVRPRPGAARRHGSGERGRDPARSRPRRARPGVGTGRARRRQRAGFHHRPACWDRTTSRRALRQRILAVLAARPGRRAVEAADGAGNYRRPVHGWLRSSCLSAARVARRARRGRCRAAVRCSHGVGPARAERRCPAARSAGTPVRTRATEPDIRAAWPTSCG